MLEVRKNLLVGLENFTDLVGMHERMSPEKNKIESLVELFGNIRSLSNRATLEDSSEDIWKEIVYPCQSLESRVMKLIKEKMKGEK